MVTDFDLYLPPCGGDAPVLYREGSLPFTEEIRQRLAENGVRKLFISRKQQRAYHQYLESTLGAIIADTSIPLEERSETLYLSAQHLVHEAMEDPRSGNIIERSASMVDHTVKLLYSEEDSFEHLMKVTSFDYYTYTHCVNVFVFTTALAQRLGFDEDEVKNLSQGALLHDVGKSQISKDIINCSTALSDEQWAEMRMDPTYGHQILTEQGVTNEVVLDVTLHHHEKLNGSGYPDGLEAQDISH